MPELPEVETVVRTLRPHLVGRTFTDAKVYWHRTIGAVPVEDFRQRLVNRSIVDVSRRAKYIVLTLDGSDRITIHLRMTGELRFSPPDTAERPELQHRRLSFHFQDGSWLDFDDVRKFGRIQILDEVAWRELNESLGVEPLDAGFTAETLHSIFHGRRRQLKPLLLDQRIIAGIGNIYADEALFRARLHPLQASDRISTVKSKHLHESIVDVLGNAIEHRGTTLQNYRSGLGEQGENQSQLQIYGSAAGSPCPRCGSPIKKITVGQRGTVFCPRCQRKR